ncbi:hypothetical protein NDU88_005838 [Pleurodeles waltl]|uniref:Uncharacterized protein n=1 Tax=Pleurodeles waltl TaxID=8319 RepID=A0AAV7MXW2_PLEWA|nr:hypothetical protein NDU88_005838 [Pleurodeles waltl]
MGGSSDTSYEGQGTGKEVPTREYETEAQGYKDNKMEFDYMEDSPEEGAIIEGESNKEEEQGEVLRGVANIVCRIMLQGKVKQQQAATERTASGTLARWQASRRALLLTPGKTRQVGNGEHERSEFGCGGSLDEIRLRHGTYVKDTGVGPDKKAKRRVCRYRSRRHRQGGRSMVWMQRKAEKARTGVGVQSRALTGKKGFEGRLPAGSLSPADTVGRQRSQTTGLSLGYIH